MAYKTLLVNKEDSVLSITLNRPEVRNALNDELINDLTNVFSKEAQDDDVRAIIIKGSGKVFSAGGDLNWMKKSVSFSKNEILKDAQIFSNLLETINTFPKPVIGRVHGAAIGGGMGLVSVCDYVIALKETQFGFPEVKLGLIPATISPFVFAKLGESQSRALFILGNNFSAEKAREIGFVHQVVDSLEKLNEATTQVIQNITANSPQAMKSAKKFIEDLKGKPRKDQNALACQVLVDTRTTDEAKEGMLAFLEKRKPKW